MPLHFARVSELTRCVHHRLCCCFAVRRAYGNRYAADAMAAVGMMPVVDCTEMLGVAKYMNDILNALDSPDLTATAASGMPVPQGSPTAATSAMQTAPQASITAGCLSMEDTETIALRIFVTLQWLSADHEDGVKLFQQMPLYSVLFTLLSRMLPRYLYDGNQNVTALFDAGLELLLRLWKCFDDQHPPLPTLCRALLWRVFCDKGTSSQLGLAGITAMWSLLGNALPYASKQHLLCCMQKKCLSNSYS